jgi:dihydroorotate dehydrogenase (NAD+) catalytic subunit
MNYESERIIELLNALLGQRPRHWLAKKLDVTDNAVKPWFKGGRIQDENVSKIEALARTQGIEPALFQKPSLIWDFRQSYETNINNPVPEPPHVPPLASPVTTILGHPVTGVVGAAASVLTSSAHLVRYLANVGVDIIVYKTVRSGPYKPHPKPNAFVCDETRLLTTSTPQTPYHVMPVDDATLPYKALVNRYGMPSSPPEQWTIDFRAASRHVKPGQLLILSVTGTATRDDPPNALIDDFAQVVSLGREAGATIIELNLSCPNCSGREGEVFKDLPTSVAICQAARATAGNVKLVVKIGFMPKAQLLEFAQATVEFVDGFSAINSFPVEAHQDGQTAPVNAFGQPGLKAGLTGRPILPLGVATVAALHEFREERGLQFCILGSGGVMEPNDVLTYLDAGADAVMLATVLFSDPLFALRARPHWQQWEQSLGDRANPIELARLPWSRASSQASDIITDPEELAIVAGAVFAKWQATYASNAALRGAKTGHRIPDQDEFYRMIIADYTRRVRFNA